MRSIRSRKDIRICWLSDRVGKDRSRSWKNVWCFIAGGDRADIGGSACASWGGVRVGIWRGIACATNSVTSIHHRKRARNCSPQLRRRNSRGRGTIWFARRPHSLLCRLIEVNHDFTAHFATPLALSPSMINVSGRAIVIVCLTFRSSRNKLLSIIISAARHVIRRGCTPRYLFAQKHQPLSLQSIISLVCSYLSWALILFYTIITC